MTTPQTQVSSIDSLNSLKYFSPLNDDIQIQSFQQQLLKLMLIFQLQFHQLHQLLQVSYCVEIAFEI